VTHLSQIMLEQLRRRNSIALHPHRTDRNSNNYKPNNSSNDVHTPYRPGRRLTSSRGI